MAERPTLALDCGTAWTKVALFDTVEGVQRLVARAEALSTHLPPVADAAVGVLQAVRDLERFTGRELITSGDDPRPVAGVALFACGSAAPPLRVFAFASQTQLSAMRSLLAVSGCAAAGIAPLEDAAARRRAQTWEQEQLAALTASRPQVAVIALDSGSARAGAQAAARLLAAAAESLEAPRRVLIVGGGEEAARLASQVGGSLEVALVADTPALKDALLEAHGAESMQCPGMPALASWLGAPPMPTAAAEATLAGLVASRHGMQVAIADVGASSCLVLHASESGEVSAARVEAGAGAGAQAVLGAVGPEAIARWLPHGMAPDTLEAAIARLGSEPASEGDAGTVALVYALAREVLRLAAGGADPAAGARGPRAARGLMAEKVDLLVGTGGTLGRETLAGHTLLALLDGLQPRGLSQVAQDPARILPLLGAIARSDPDLALGLFEHDCVVNLGTCVAPVGELRAAEPVLHATFDRQERSLVTLPLAAGTLRVVPLGYGEKASVKLYPSPRCDVGLGKAGAPGVADVEGGLCGVLLDGRGRPIRWDLPASDSRGAAAAWLEQSGVRLAPGPSSSA